MTDINDTTVDDITRQLTRSASYALRAAREAIDRHRLLNARQREEARRDREHRLRNFENQLRTTIVQRRASAQEGNRQLATELAAIEHQQRDDELIARWAAAEAHRDSDPAHADAWTARLRENGIDPDAARARAVELAYEPWDEEEMSDTEQLATDYTDMATDFAERRSDPVPQLAARVADLEDGAEAARLIGIARHPDRAMNSISAVPVQVPSTGRAVDTEYIAGL